MLTKQKPKDLIQHIDFTTLLGNENQEEILSFLNTGITKIDGKQIACFCLDKKFASLAKKFLDQHKITNILLASVVNFPKGNSNIKIVADQIHFALDGGVDEIDYVLDYNSIIAGKYEDVLDELHKVRAICKSCVLKVIIESGVLRHANLIDKASKLSIEAGANFIKTSTGKTSIGATIEAAEIILDNIVKEGVVCGKSQKVDNQFVGIKVSGGVSDVETAWQYYSLVQDKLGIANMNKHNFRIGTSKLFNNIINDLK